MKNLIPFYPYLSGISTLVPGLHSFSPIGGTNSATYSLRVFLRHLSIYYQHSGKSRPPSTILELGPGNSIGFGLAAMLAYDCDYFSFDTGTFFDSEINLAILERLYECFRTKSLNSNDIPPDFLPKSESTMSISEAISWGRSTQALERRYQIIKNRLQNPLPHPWTETLGSTPLTPQHETVFISSREIPSPQQLDCIFSQAVLEHIDDLPGFFIYLNSISCPTTIHSHEIDLSSHNITSEWNGHWQFSEKQWYIVRGLRPHFINRRPYSYFSNLFDNLGYTTIHCDRYQNSGRRSIPPHKAKITTEPNDFLAHSCYFLMSIR